LRFLRNSATVRNSNKIAAFGSADLRLAVVSPFVDCRHGTERALAELLKRLVDSYQCEIHLYSGRVEGLALDDPHAPLSGKTGAIFWHRVPAFAGPQLAKFLFWLMANTFLRWFHRVFRGVRFDLVLSPGINCLDPDAVIVHVLFHRLQELSREARRGASMQTGLLRRWHRRAYYGLLTALERRVYSDRSVSLAGVSERTADHLRQYFRRSEVRVIPNGVDTREFSVSTRLLRRSEARRRRTFREADFVLLLIGNDWRVKGVPAILAAMAAAAGVSFFLMVVGDDAAEPFREMARDLAIGERCRWERFRPDVMDLYAAADVYVSPSREDSFGLPVAEAMACGLPVITSVFAGVSSLIRNEVDGFVLRDPCDERALAQLLLRLHGDTALRSRVANAAEKAAQEWTWERNAAEVWELLKVAAANKNCSRT
jgi:glycosyltransferase involved in cell wall biosynthesis